MAYDNKVIDHYENPRNVGSLDKESQQLHELNGGNTKVEGEVTNG